MHTRAPQRSLGAWPALAGLFAVLAIAATFAASWGAVDNVAGWNAAFTASAICALAGMLAARRASAPEHRYRWGCWVAAAALWLGGQIAWNVFSAIGFPTSPNVADLGWYGFAVLVIVGLLRSPAGTPASRAVAIVEVLPLVAAAMALTFAELWTHSGASSLPTAARLSALAYPALYVFAAILTLQVMVGGSLRQIRGPGPRLVLLGIVIQAIAFISWTGQLLHEEYVPGTTLIDPLWVAGLLAIGAGGVLAGRRPEPPVRTDEMSRRGGILPAITFILLVAALVHMGVEDPPLGAQLSLAAGALMSGSTMLVRTMLLERRLRELLELERTAREELAGREAELARLNARLREDSRRDPLTGLRNRRALVEDLPDLELDARRRGQSFAIAICDVDRFKAYNDKLGHIAGDQALRAIAATVRMQLRAGDAAYRYGGEELVLVLRDADGREALAAAERVRAAVEAAGLAHPADPRGIITVSIGVAAGKGDAPSLLSHADRALYEAKHGGRNGVRAAAGDAGRKPARRRTDAVEQPLLRHLRGLLEISRAAASGRGPLPVLESMAGLIRNELQFQTVAVNLREGDEDDLRVVLVAGDEDARQALLGNVNPWTTWHPLLDEAHHRLGASWLPAGSHEWSEALNAYTPESGRSLGPDGWDPEDMLLLPLRGATGEVLGIVSVDEPFTGRRPTDDELRVLMAVADHAALALEQVLSHGGGSPSGEAPELRLAAAMLLAETLDLRDAGTAEHSRTVGALRPRHGRGPRTGARSRRPPARRRRAARPGQARDRRRDPAQGGRAHRGRVDGDDPPPRDRRAHPRARRPARHRGLGARPPRAPRRSRLPERAGRRRDPARGAHPRGRGRLRGDDRRPPLPARHAGRGGARGAASAARARSSIRPWSRPSSPRCARRGPGRGSARPCSCRVAHRVRSHAPAITLHRRSTSAAVVCVWPIETRMKRVSAEHRRRDVERGSRVDRRGQRVGGRVAVAVAEADEREGDRRDALERGCSSTRLAELVRERDVLAQRPRSPARRSCAAPTTASARGSGGRAGRASRGSRSPRRTPSRRRAGTAAGSTASRSAARGRPPTARCSRSW